VRANATGPGLTRRCGEQGDVPPLGYTDEVGEALIRADERRKVLDELEKSGALTARGVVGFWPADACADDITLTLMLAMERLSPLERAAFLLHDVFDTPLPEVAATLRTYADAGASRSYLQIMDLDDLDHLELIATALRAELS